MNAVSTLSVPEAQFIQVPGEPEQHVIVSTRIPKRYYEVIKDMVDMDPEDSVEWWLSRSIKLTVEADMDCPDWIFDIMQDRWKGMLKS